MTVKIEVTEPTLGDEMPPGYRMTELGVVPEEWRVVALGDLAEVRGETVGPSARPGLRHVGLEHLKPGAREGGEIGRTAV